MPAIPATSAPTRWPIVALNRYVEADGAHESKPDCANAHARDKKRPTAAMPT
jgi:hypothetical protein